MARGEFLIRQKQYEAALVEYGRVSKQAQEDPVWGRRVEQALEALLRPKTSAGIKPTSRPQTQFTQQLRVIRRKHDADKNSDQSGDDRGWQVNESLWGLHEKERGVNTRFVVDVDGFRDGHNDLRYRTLLADFFKGDSHLGLGDSATYPAPFFMRASRLRGIDWIVKNPANEFQLVAGAYPVWLEGRDEYIYPRSVWGIRDKFNMFSDRVRLGANVIQTRDSEKIRTEDGANPQARVDPIFQPRDNVVYSLDQEIKIVPEVWSFKASEGYSTTDDNLIEDRFGNTTKLKDFAFEAESNLVAPLFRWKGTISRVGPDFRLLTDLPAGASTSPKDYQADLQRITQFLDVKPIGPFDVDLEASWTRNDLKNNDSIEHTRQGWLTADVGIETPPAWPQPRLRGTYFETVSSPGSVTRASQTRTYETTGEFHKYLWETDWTPFATYHVEHPVKDKDRFDEEDQWSVGIKAARPLSERLLVNSRYEYTAFDELFDEVRRRGIHHEVDAGGNLRLWSTANLSANYTYLKGQLTQPGGTQLVHGEGHAVSLAATWPLTKLSWDKRRRWSLLPAIHYHLTDLSRDFENHTLVTGRLTLAYEVYDAWRLELMGEYRVDDDDETELTHTEGMRAWLLWTSHFGR